MRPVVVVAIVSCAPFVTAALAAALGVEEVRARQFAGALIGLGGVVMLTGLDAGAVNLAGVALAALGALAFSLATLVLRARARGLNAQALNFWQSVAGAALLAPFAFFDGRGFGGGEGLSPVDPALARDPLSRPRRHHRRHGDVARADPPRGRRARLRLPSDEPVLWSAAGLGWRWAPR